MFVMEAGEGFMGWGVGRSPVHTCDLVGVDVCDWGGRHALCEGGLMRLVQEVPHVHTAILLGDVEHTGASWGPVACTQSHWGRGGMQDRSTLKTACRYMLVIIAQCLRAHSSTKGLRLPSIYM